jgi:hypothetical protein
MLGLRLSGGSLLMMNEVGKILLDNAQNKADKVSQID